MRNDGIPEGRKLPQIVAILASSLSGIYDGMLYAWTSPSTPKLISDSTINISLEEASYFTMICPVAMVITSPMFSALIEVRGRRIGILVLVVPAIIAWICVILGTNIWVYYISRICAGIVDAGTFTVIPIYICEIAQPTVRSDWGNMAGITIYVGVFLINTIGSYLTIEITAIVCLSITIIHLTLFWCMPESPYYLIMQNKEEEARVSLRKLRGVDDVDDEFRSIKKDVTRQLSESGSMLELFSIKSNRSALFIAILVRLAQQLSGLAAFETYTQYMFIQAGKEISESTSSIVFTGVMALGICISSYLIKGFGRRPLLIISCFGCGVILGLLSIYMYVHDFTSINLSNISWFPLVGMSMYIVFFAPGMGPFPTIIVGELFSSSIKSKAVSIMNIFTAVCFLVVPKFFQSMTYNYGMFVPFATFSISCIVFAVLSYFYVIETKGKSLEDIQQELKGNK